jgi:effector-binding domain-containing protein/uncharacterized protein YndB with AHSA1/START domain
MKFLKWLGIILFSLLALFLIIPLFLPGTFHVERTTTIERPVDMVFQAAVDMNQRAKWDPWIEMEPDVEMEVSITPEIIGSGYSWKGEIIGEGKITIQEFVPNNRIKSEIEFFEPQSMKSDIIWNFIESEEGTKISWAFEGSLSYPVEKWFGLFMEKSMGPQFEKGLKNFKNFVESQPLLNGRTGEIKEETFDGLIAMTMKEECAKNNVNGKMISMYSSLLKHLKTNNEDIAGFPFAIYRESEIEGNVQLECGLPVSKKLEDTETITYRELPESKVLVASHFGHFNSVETTYKILKEYIAENNIEVTGTPWEMYLTDPMKEPDQNKWETKIYFPIQ